MPCAGIKYSTRTSISINVQVEYLIPAKVITSWVRDHPDWLCQGLLLVNLIDYITHLGSIFGQGKDFNPVAVASTWPLPTPIPSGESNPW